MYISLVPYNIKVTGIIETLDYLSPIEANSPTRSFEHYYMYNIAASVSILSQTVSHTQLGVYHYSLCSGCPWSGG